MSGPRYNSKSGEWELPSDRQTPDYDRTDHVGVPPVPRDVPLTSPPESGPQARKWPWLLALVLVFAVGVAVGVAGHRAYVSWVISQALTEAFPTAPLSDNPVPTGPRTFTLEVTAEGVEKIGNISWGNGQGGQESRENRATPWSTEVTVPADRPYDNVTLVAQIPYDADTGVITCTVRGAGGVVLDTETSRGQFATAACGSNGP